MAFTDRVEFTKEMKKEGYTILAPNMAPIHFRLFENLFASYGYNVEILQTRGRQIVDEGLKYVHNDTSSSPRRAAAAVLRTTFTF